MPKDASVIVVGGTQIEEILVKSRLKTAAFIALKKID